MRERDRELRAREREREKDTDRERKTEILWNKRSNLVSEDSVKPDYVVSVNDH